jgi:hypothetical protein
MSVRPELSALIKAERPDRSGGPIVYQTDLVQIRRQYIERMQGRAWRAVGLGQNRV